MATNTQFRHNAVTSLTSEIANLTGSQFEVWAYRYIQFLLPGVVWNHRGTNSIGAPVGYTVDSAGDNASVVAQYSSQVNYFETDKPLVDLESAFEKHSNVQKIYLVAAAESGPKGRTETDNAIAKWIQSRPEVQVVLLDGRNIAEYIVDNLASDELVESLKDALPSLGRLAEENAFSHSLPRLGPHVPRPNLISSATAVLNERSYVILGGISGVGKSDLAVRLAQTLDVESHIWLDATSFAGPEDLQAVSTARRGIQHNIQSLLKHRRCVVILDNLHALWNSAAFEAIVGLESYLIVTSQVGGGRADVVAISNANPDESKRMLELGSISTCPNELFEDIWKATKGHPLLLRLLGRVAEEHNWNWSKSRECCETLISYGEDDRNEKICRRILRQHLPAIREELIFFIWCDSSSVDTAFLKACTSPFAENNLAKRHLLTASTDRTIKLHDIVFASAKMEVTLDPQIQSRFRNQLDRFINDAMNNDNLVLERFARRHSIFLLREYSHEKGWEVLYAIARARIEQSAIESFGDIQAEAQGLLQGGPPREIALRAIIEAVEATFSLLSETGTKQEAKDRLQAMMPVFDILASLDISVSLASDVQHHRAKMLTRLGQHEEAERIFTQLLRENPEMHAAKLQLVRLLASNRKETATALALELIDSIGVRPSVTIQIAAWAEVAKLNPEVSAARIAEIVAILRGISQGDAAAAYGLVAKLGSSLAYDNPGAVLKLFEAIKDSEPSFSSDRERVDFARSQVVAAKAFRERSADSEADALLKSAREIYEMANRVKMSEFHKNQFAECLLLLNDPSAALEVLETVPTQQRSAFWYHRYSQAQLGIGAHTEALKAIDDALENVDDDKYIAAFREVRSDILFNMNASGALEELEEAIRATDSDKFREQLEKKRTERYPQKG